MRESHLRGVPQRMPSMRAAKPLCATTVRRQKTQRRTLLMPHCRPQSQASGGVIASLYGDDFPCVAPSGSEPDERLRKPLSRALPDSGCTLRPTLNNFEIQ
ncbi:hypothetical protein GCM10009655_08950 [Rhodoglobus aureus]|uniref:Uncharacterized protein n=1 Tax=Rhodoglobus aureus TaxID=191497 RepID=A0ABN1VJB7_9MICO